MVSQLRLAGKQLIDSPKRFYIWLISRKQWKQKKLDSPNTSNGAHDFCVDFQALFMACFIEVFPMTRWKLVFWQIVSCLLFQRPQTPVKMQIVVCGRITPWVWNYIIVIDQCLSRDHRKIIHIIRRKLTRLVLFRTDIFNFAFARWTGPYMLLHADRAVRRHTSHVSELAPVKVM